MLDVEHSLHYLPTSVEKWYVSNELTEDLNSFVPNFKIAADRATSSTINVYKRGVGQSDPLWGFQPAVGVYIDDVYLARPQTAPEGKAT